MGLGGLDCDWDGLGGFDWDTLKGVTLICCVLTSMYILPFLRVLGEERWGVRF